MKKSVLALAVAAALSAPLVAQADTILYGSARVSVDYNDDDPASGYWDVVNNSSRIGVLGSEELGGGLSAVYQYEFGVDMTEGGNLESSNRPKFVGLKGGFGTLTLGTQESPYYHVASVIDIFNTDKSLGATAFLGGSFNGFSLNPTADRDYGEGSLFRLENSLYYATPDFNGFSGEAMLVMNGAKNDPSGYSDSIDLWNIAAKYSSGPFFAGVSYIQLDGDSSYSIGNGLALDLDLSQWNVGLGYAAGAFTIGLMYEQGTLNEFGLLNNVKVNNVKVFGGDDATNVYLAGSYTFGNNVVSAAYGQLDPGTDGSDSIDNYLLGYQYNFSKRTRMWVEYIGRSADSNTTLYGDQTAFSIGTRVDF
ncbi:MAG: porin [Candidatus Competibacteraceae bacterium]|nr:MAG: porin [Candidatus Competibacteraceae bacterium]